MTFCGFYYCKLGFRTGTTRHMGGYEGVHEAVVQLLAGVAHGSSVGDGFLCRA